MEAVAKCWGCGEPVDPADVQRVQSIENRKVLVYIHECGATGQTLKTEKAYKRFLARWQNYKMQGKTEIDKIYDPEEVGILVAGFRDIDLASIDTAEDLIQEWRTSWPPMEKTARWTP